MHESVFFVFQPKLKQGLIYGYESLIRARNFEGDVFFPFDMMQRHKGDIYFDYFIVNKAVKQVFHNSNLHGHNISINVSSDFLNYLDTSCFDFDFASLPFNIEFEILEDIKIIDFSIANKNMLYMKSLGAKFSLDDFGKDYSCLERLWNLSFDMVKLDRSLTLDVDINAEKWKRLNVTINYIKSNFDVEILAEGVESSAQYDALFEMGIEYYQGFYFGKPC
ncbi:EAL domain-containing protein [Vibrio diabolicus]